MIILLAAIMYFSKILPLSTWKSIGFIALGVLLIILAIWTLFTTIYLVVEYKSANKIYSWSFDDYDAGHWIMPGFWFAFAIHKVIKLADKYLEI